MEKDNKALIFNKVHGSFVDGYGVRTTIFLKGCPLKCIWCCNPEGQSFEPELRLLAERCNGCGLCEDECPKKAISIVDRQAVVDRTLCDACMKCINVCYTDALLPFGEWMSVDEIYEYIKKDIKYYQTTGGGLTIGGGEATCYPEFVSELIDRCHKDRIPVAIDTCGYMVSQKGMECLKKADLILFDIKGIDDTLHKKNTGVSNRPILETLRKLADLRKPVIIRLPLIPGYNDTMEKLQEVAELILHYPNIERLDILPFHDFGKSKYAELGKSYELKIEYILNEKLEEIKAYFTEKGINTQLGG